MNEINESEFSARTQQGTALVEFGAEWCGPCKTMIPVLNRISTEYVGKLDVFSVDIDKSPALAAKLGIMSVPTILLFRDGAQVERMVGVVSERELKKRIDRCMGGS